MFDLGSRRWLLALMGVGVVVVWIAGVTLAVIDKASNAMILVRFIQEAAVSPLTYMMLLFIGIAVVAGWGNIQAVLEAYGPVKWRRGQLLKKLEILLREAQELIDRNEPETRADFSKYLNEAERWKSDVLAILSDNCLAGAAGEFESFSDAEWQSVSASFATLKPYEEGIVRNIRTLLEIRKNALRNIVDDYKKLCG